MLKKLFDWVKNMCDLALYRDNNNGNTMISNLFIDEYLSDANDAQIKVYLYLIRMTNCGRPTNISDIADKFNHTEKDVCRALRYWERKGLLSLDHDDHGVIVGIRLYDPSVAPRQTQPSRNNSFTPVMATFTQAPIKTATDDNSHTLSAQPVIKEPTTFTKPSYTLGEIKEFKNRENATSLVFIVESYLKKQLTSNDIRSIMFYTDELRFSDELVDFLVQFCVTRKQDKTTFAYIDKVAIDWAENGITKVSQAKKYAAEFDKAFEIKTSNKSRNKISTAFHQFEQRDYDFDKLEEQLLRRN